MTKLYFPLICFKFIFALNCCFRESDLRCNTKPSSLLFFFFFFQHRRRRLFGPSARLTVPKASFGSIIRRRRRGSFWCQTGDRRRYSKETGFRRERDKKGLLLTTWSELKKLFLFFKKTFIFPDCFWINSCVWRKKMETGKKKETRDGRKKISTIKKKKMRDSSVCGQKFEELDVPRPGTGP